MSEKIINNSHTLIDGMLFNPADLYTLIIDSIKSKEVKGIGTRIVRKKTNGFFSSSRDYLEISYASYIFLVGASPYGKSTMFMSWWLSDHTTSKIPMPGVIGRMIGNFVEPFSMYKTDEMSAFLTLTKHIIGESLAEITKGQSVRIVTEAARVPE